MKKLLILAFLAAVVVVAWFLLPAPPRTEPGGGHANHGGDPAALTDGVVLAIDKGAGSITISHGPIQYLGMPGMTMGFRASDPALLEAVKAGDRVRFHADVVGGAFTVMKIERLN